MKLSQSSEAPLAKFPATIEPDKLIVPRSLLSPPPLAADEIPAMTELAVIVLSSTVSIAAGPTL
jgi:hypothetical protein